MLYFSPEVADALAGGLLGTDACVDIICEASRAMDRR